MPQFSEYMQDLTSKLAEMFTKHDSQVIVNEPRKGSLSGYADGERYSASIINPDLEKLPEGIRDAMKRLDLRFKLDTALEYLEACQPAMWQDFRDAHLVDLLEEDIFSEREKQDKFLELKGQYLSKGYLARDETQELRELEKNQRNSFKHINVLIEETWKQLQTFMRKQEHEYFLTPPEKPIFDEAMQYIEERRPLKKDSYDIYIQTLVDNNKEKPFGLVLCDGISSQYMTQAEAEQIKRDQKNEFLDHAILGKSLKNPDQAKKCAMMGSWFGAIPEKISQVAIIAQNLLHDAYSSLSPKTLSEIVQEQSVKHESQDEDKGPAPA